MAIEKINATDTLNAGREKINQAIDSLVNATGNIINVSGAPKSTFSTLSALQTAYPNGTEGVFLVLENGHWYYYASAWKDGGLYQATGIADGSVTPAKLNTEMQKSLPIAIYPTPNYQNIINQFPDNNNVTFQMIGPAKSKIVINRTKNGYIGIVFKLGKYKDLRNKILRIAIKNLTSSNVLDVILTGQYDWSSVIVTKPVNAINGAFNADIPFDFGDSVPDERDIYFTIRSLSGTGKLSMDFESSLLSIDTNYKYLNEPIDRVAFAYDAENASIAENAGFNNMLKDVSSNKSIFYFEKSKANSVRFFKNSIGENLGTTALYWIGISYNNLDDLDFYVYLDTKNNKADGISSKDFTSYLVGGRVDWSPANNPIGVPLGTKINLKKSIVSAGKQDYYANRQRLYLLLGSYNPSPNYYDDKIWDFDVIFYGINNNIVIASDIDPDLLPKLTAFKDEIVAIGDSLTAIGGWTDTLSSLSGLPIFNGGTGGENVRTIVARAGADVMTVENVTIPNDLTEVKVADYAGFTTQFGYKATPLRQGGYDHINPISINGLKGTLRFTGTAWNDTSGVYMFKRSIIGDALTITRTTPMTTNLDRVHNNPYLLIVFMGQNGGFTDDNDLVRMHRLMLEHSKSKYQLILGMHTGTASSRASYEQAMLTAFGRKFFSLRQYLAHPVYESDGTTIKTCWGLQDVGLTPTADDLAKIAVGQVPLPLMVDGTHYTDATKTAIGNAIYSYLVGLSIF